MVVSLIVKIHEIFLQCTPQSLNFLQTKLLLRYKLKHTRPQFMEMLSFARSPVAPVLLRRSDPARSTKWNFAVRVSNSLDGSVVTNDSPSSIVWKKEKGEKKKVNNTKITCFVKLYVASGTYLKQ